MEQSGTKDVSVESVNYEEPALGELQLDGVDYRLDPGRGSAVAVSQRRSGSWDWTPVTEGRWDGSRLHAKSLDHKLVTALAGVLATAMRERGEQGES